jgi:twitching motility protein PilU
MYLTRLFKLMAERSASDLFVTCGAPIHIKVNNQMVPVSTQPIDPTTAKTIAYEMMNDQQIERFERDLEMNVSHIEPELGNFRINIMKQRGTVSMVVRFIRVNIPQFEKLSLPPVLLDLIMAKRGLILVVGATGSGKSTTLASLIDYRSQRTPGHIITLEDPVEYLMQHKRSLINQREIGHDTKSYDAALVNALRQAPDVLMIGEVRERATFQHVLTHTLTGHMCLTTLHANNAYHALSRILAMYPQEHRNSLLSDLSYGLRAIIAQRLIRTTKGTLQPAVEILLNTHLISEFIQKGELEKVKEAMEQSLTQGSQTFEQALAKMVIDGTVDMDEALSASDSPTNLTWLLNNAAHSQAVASSGPSAAGTSANTPASKSLDFDIKLS